MNDKKETAQEVPVQEQSKVTYSYLVEQPSRIILTNDKNYFDGIVQNYETIYMFGPELTLVNEHGEPCLNQFNSTYLVQILLDKQGNPLKKAIQAE